MEALGLKLCKVLGYCDHVADDLRRWNRQTMAGVDDRIQAIAIETQGFVLAGGVNRDMETGVFEQSRWKVTRCQKRAERRHSR